MRVLGAALLMWCMVGAGVFVPAPAMFAAPPTSIAAQSAPSDLEKPADVEVAKPGTNLLVNPGAEVGLCSTSGYDAMTLPGWTVIDGSPDALCYSTPGFAPSAGHRGRAYFAGGATGDGAMVQAVDISSASPEVDRGLVKIDLGGALGGFSTQNDRVRVTATYIDAGGSVLDAIAVPVVTNTTRGGVSALMPQHVDGPVPIGTREIDVSVEFLWTAGDTTDAYADDLSLRISTPVNMPALQRPQSNVPKFDHVFFVFMENENFAASEAPSDTGDYIVGNPAAPYLNRTLARQGSLLGRMYATTHPSDPNYLAVTGGSTFGYTTNPRVGIDKIDAVHIGDRLSDAGKTWAGYAGGMAYPCDMTTHNNDPGGHYLPDDEPFMLYADVVADPFVCAAHNKPLEQLPIDLRRADTTPNLVWFAADDEQNMEDGGVAMGDKWLSQVLPLIFKSPAWTTERSLLIVSWDEGHRKAFGPDYPNHVATYVLGSQASVKAGYVSPLRYTDYSLGATICDALGVPTMTSNDEYAERLSDVWQHSSGGSPSGGAAYLRPR